MLNHVPFVLRQTGLVIPRLQASKGEPLSRTFETANITILIENNRSSKLSNTWNGKDRMIQLTNTLRNLCFDLICFGIHMVFTVDGNFYLLRRKSADLTTVFFAKAFRCANVTIENIPRGFFRKAS